MGPEAVLPPDVAPGDRVFLGSILTCGECRWCMDGFQNLCERHLLYGYDPFPGAYAEWAPVPPIATKNLIRLPDDLPSDLATVADPFACALNGVEMLDVRLGDTVVILGTGPIGCWQAVMCRDRGASRIYMTDVKQDRLDVPTGAVGPGPASSVSRTIAPAHRLTAAGWIQPRTRAEPGSFSRNSSQGRRR